jgi:hypothetical protein
MAGI